MVNKYQQRKQHKGRVHEDMEIRVSSEAMNEFRRKPYPAIQYKKFKELTDIKIDLDFLKERAANMDSWEKETISRIAKRIREGVRYGE